jgi:hypothetical protein
MTAAATPRPRSCPTSRRVHFEAPRGPTVAASDSSGGARLGAASPRDSRVSRTCTCATTVTSPVRLAVCPSGRARARPSTVSSLTCAVETSGHSTPMG